MQDYISKSYKRKTPKIRRNNLGFTIIELIVVVVTMILLFGLGFANYRGFRERQVLRSAAREIIADLRFTQQQALAGRKPAGCTILNGFLFRYVSSTSYQIFANCDANVDIALPSKPAVDFATKYPGIQFSAAFSDVFFNILGRGVRSGVTITLSQTPSGAVRSITITQAGEIN